MDTIDRLFDVLRGAGQHRYGESAVTQLEHALQCAALAESEDASPALITAALLHDVGHLANPDDHPAALRGEDGRHEDTGAALLARMFGPDVTEPVRLHVPAKRYLTAVEPAYFAALSQASVRSLALQGGPLSESAARAFKALHHAGEAVRLRRWDDGAKLPGRPTPPLDHFRRYLEGCLKLPT